MKKITPTLPVQTSDLVHVAGRIRSLLLEAQSLVVDIANMMGEARGAAELNKRKCQLCGAMFMAGYGSGRRANAKFCCVEHKIEFHSFKRSRKSGMIDTALKP